MRSTLLSLTPSGALSVPGEKFRHGLDAGRHHLVHHPLGGIRGHRNDRNADVLFRRNAPEILDVEDGDAAARLLPHLIGQRVEERDDLKPLLAESGIIRERQPQVAGAENRHLQLSFEAQDLPKVPLEILDVIPHAPHAELPEVRQVLPDLGGIEVELLRQRLGRDGLDVRRLELVQAAQVH